MSCWPEGLKLQTLIFPVSSTTKKSFFSIRLTHRTLSFKQYSLGRKKHQKASVLLHMCSYPQLSVCSNHAIPIAVCLPCGLPEEPFRKRAADCSPPERQAKDSAAKSAQETLSSQAHSPLGGQNGLTPFPNNTQRISFPVCLLVFPRSQKDWARPQG